MGGAVKKVWRPVIYSFIWEVHPGRSSLPLGLHHQLLHEAASNEVFNQKPAKGTSRDSFLTNARCLGYKVGSLRFFVVFPLFWDNRWPHWCPLTDATHFQLVLWFLPSCILFFFFFSGHTHDMWEFPGQGSYPRHSGVLNYLGPQASPPQCVLTVCPLCLLQRGDQAASPWSLPWGNIHTAGETHWWNTKGMQCVYHVIKVKTPWKQSDISRKD